MSYNMLYHEDNQLEIYIYYSFDIYSVGIKDILVDGWLTLKYIDMWALKTLILLSLKIS